MQYAEQDEEGTSHQSGDGQSFKAILLYDAIDDNDKGSCGTADLHLASTQKGDDEASHDGSDDALLRRYS